LKFDLDRTLEGQREFFFYVRDERFDCIDPFIGVGLCFEDYDIATNPDGF
jgi:hypothetical protein